MTTGISAISTQVQRYFQRQEGVDLPITGIFDALIGASPCERWGLVRSIQLHGKKRGVPVELFTKLKASICQGANGNWKNILLDSHYEEKLTLLHTRTFTYSNSLALSIDSEKRFCHISVAPFAAVFGSTFATSRNEKEDLEHHLLDAAFSAVCRNGQGQFAGYALAVADGGGGHLGDTKQDFNIARAAYGAAQTCVRLFSAYEDPDALFRDLGSISKEIGKEVRRKGKGESTTLVVCRAFPIQEGFRLIGLNIGDSLLMSWHPASKQAQNLLSSHVTQGGTALLPESYKDFEMYRLDVILPRQSLLFFMTDGVHDLLPHTEQEGIYTNALPYRTRTLTDIANLFDKIPPEKCLGKLFHTCIQSAEKSRLEHQKDTNFHMGDDFTLLQCYLE